MYEKLGHYRKVNGPILCFAAPFGLQIDREMSIDWESPYLLQLGHYWNDPILCFAASTVKCQSRLSTCSSSETPHPLKRPILWNSDRPTYMLPYPLKLGHSWNGPILCFAASTVKLPISTEKRCFLWNTPSSETPHPVKFRTTEKHPILRTADRPRNMLPFKTPLHLKFWTTDITKSRPSELCSVMFLTSIAQLLRNYDMDDFNCMSGSQLTAIKLEWDNLHFSPKNCPALLTRPWPKQNRPSAMMHLIRFASGRSFGTWHIYTRLMSLWQIETFKLGTWS